VRFLSLFSGIEAASCAWMPLGWECAGVSEIEPFPCSLLKHRYPDVPNLGDITKISRNDIESLGKIDLVVGGFPCQDVSIAGKKRGLRNADGTATRSGLFFDAMRIVEWAKPRWTVIENVPNLLGNNGGRDFAAVVGTLAGTGIDVPEGGWRNTGVAAGRSGLVEWSVLDAQWRGLAQRRKRVFLVRDSGDWQSRPPVLIEPESLCGNPPSRGEAGKDVAGTISARTQGGGGLGTDFDLDGGLVPEVSHCLNAGGMGRIDYESETFIATGAGYWSESDQAATLGTQARALYESTCVAFSSKDSGCDAGEISPTLRSMNHDGSHANGGGQGAVAYSIQERAVSDSETSGPQGKGCQEGIAFTLEARNKVQVVAFNHQAGGSKAMIEYNPESDITSALSSNQTPAIHDRRGVRRLTPLECERLQGFDVGYTLIPHRGKPAVDGPRYKALGNSMAVPVMRWIGERIEMASNYQEKVQ
jgi:DNA (cytosine-5)-methyltransferase 1